MLPLLRFIFPALAVPLIAGLASCGSTAPPVYQSEQFASVSPFSRTFAASSPATCDAARRALLSQGYLVRDAKDDLVDGQKSFQPQSDVHVQIEFHVVCAPNGSDGRSSTAFVNALQDRYALKKTNSSASVGVGAVGSVSLPFGSSDDSLVKIASETIPAGPFYSRFFGLVEFYLGRGRNESGEPEPGVPTDAPK